MVRALCIALIVCAATAFLWAAGRDAKPQTVERRTTTQRVQEGPRIVSSTKISEAETVRVLVIPHPLGEFFDTICVIYVNRDVGAATMNCPTAHQGEISVPELEKQR
jgi:hypothetical protein